VNTQPLMMAPWSLNAFGKVKRLNTVADNNNVNFEFELSFTNEYTVPRAHCVNTKVVGHT
jgi:hypothetical protein